MPADVIEQLRMLRDVLDVHAAPVTLDDLRRTKMTIQLEPESTNVIHPESVGHTEPGNRWTKRALAVAAVLVVIVGLAVLGRQDRAATTPGSGNDTPSTVGSPDPSTALTADELAALDIPAGSTLRVAKVLPGTGTVSVFDTADRSQICMATSFVEGGSSGGCTDSGVVSTGEYWSFVQHSHSRSVPALLLGITATDIGFSVTVNGRIVEPDADGIWYALIPLDTSEFTITTNDGSTVVPLGHPETTPPVVASPGSVPNVAANQSSTTSSTNPPSTDTTVPVANRAPIAIGDQVMLGAKEQLESAGFVVDASASRQASDVIELIRGLRTEGRLGNTVVIHVGTNGEVTNDDLAAIMTNLPPEEVASVWFLTDYADRPWIAANNQRIMALPSSYTNVQVGYWHAFAASLPGMATDGVHLASNEAKQTYAELIATWTGITP